MQVNTTGSKASNHCPGLEFSGLNITHPLWMKVRELAYKQAKGLYWITFQRPTKDNCFSILAVSSTAQAEKLYFFRNPGRFRINLIKLNLNSQRKASKQTPEKRKRFIRKEKVFYGNKTNGRTKFPASYFGVGYFPLCNTLIGTITTQGLLFWTPCA